MSNIMEVQNLSLHFGGVKAVDDVSLTVERGGVTSIIGPNGAGKTTFFNIISGVYKPSQGTVLFDGDDITKLPQHKISRLGLSRTFQNIRLFSQLNILDNVVTSLDARAPYNIFEAVLGLPRRKKFDRLNAEKSMHMLEIVGLADYAKEKPGSLPYGKQRKLELARALASEPKLLLLDEPAAGLNPVEVDEFIQLLAEIRQMFDITILLIEHRLKVVYTLSELVYVIHFGQLLAKGSAAEIQSNPEVIKAYMGEDEE
ncbi:MAG: ABC transporter ATP-binding protein [Oscillospiraceae bacterium]|nr:ABC transporter ATP-binding protein [Oscillospiraceae bacterium]